jgi:hypothetical protein
MTKRRVTKIRVLKTALISALIFFFISLIVFVPMLIITGIAGGFLVVWDLEKQHCHL